MEALTVGSLFSGIGGLDLGLERAGMRVLWQCESDPYCRAVLRKHWPDIPCFEDIKALLADTAGERDVPEAGLPEGRNQSVLAGSGFGRPDILVGGFPCQPVSLAGKRRGAADERWLWPEFARLIRVLRPRYALMENVPGLLSGGGMAEVLADLAACGYDAEWDCVAAANVGAPHLRYRVFIVAYPASEGLEERSSVGSDRSQELKAAERGSDPMADTEDSDGRGPDGASHIWRWDSEVGGRRFVRARLQHWLPEPAVGRVAHGVPSRVDRLRALGNAVVPQVAEVIGRMIVAHAREQAA